MKSLKTIEEYIKEYIKDNIFQKSNQHFRKYSCI